jgi:potassium-transporting ATPase KdpC subunit
MSITREVTKAVRATAVLWVLVGVIYPLLILVIGQLVFPYQANGSLIKTAQGQVIGSALIGQPFKSDRYFYSRPSTINYSSANPQSDPTGILKTGVSGASNLAPSNPALLDGQRPTGGQRPRQTPADLFYTSASGLDPHIMPQSARSQVSRIASIRNIPPEQLDRLIEQNTDHRTLGIWGEPGVNVLKLNLALDKIK